MRKPRRSRTSAIIAVEQYGAGPFGTRAPRRPRRRGHQDRGPARRRRRRPLRAARTARARTRCSSRRSTATSAASRSTSPPRRARASSRTSCAAADAVYSNLRGDVPEKMRIRYDDLKHLNPAIVCCSLTGFGMTGPARRGARLRLHRCRASPAGWTSPASPTARRPSPGCRWSTISGGFVAALSLLAGVHARPPRRRRHGLRRLASTTPR